MRILSELEATTVKRPEHEPWTWPEPVLVMVSDSFKVLGLVGLALNGEPLAHAFAVNFLETLYRNGWAVAGPDGGGPGVSLEILRWSAKQNDDAGNIEITAKTSRMILARLGELERIIEAADRLADEADHALAAQAEPWGRLRNVLERYRKERG